jgi:hypothetical protein
VSNVGIIQIQKNTSHIKQSDIKISRTLQVGEVRAYNGENKLLKAEDYSSVIHTPTYGNWPQFPASNAVDERDDWFTHTSGEDQPLHNLVLTLKTPQKIRMVEVLNRSDTCCRDRLEGAVLYLLSPTGQMLYSRVLTSELKQTFNIA